MKLFKNPLNIFLMVCIIALTQPAFAAEQSPAPTTDPLTSTDRLAAAIETLTNQLATQGEYAKKDEELRKLDIAISYLNFRHRRIERLETELDREISERDQLEDLARQWSERQEQLISSIEEAGSTDKKELEKEKSNYDIRKKALEQRIFRLSEEIIVKQNRIADLNEQLDTVERYVRQNLTL
ncbi:MAG: hypothetical protein C0618_01140 [Desulfuromonas sp.]|nr:MAG: hypothetical protein C0618_01140 [Desulfuromonas sp.]